MNLNNDFNYDGECYPGYEDALTLAEIYRDLEQEGSDKWDEWVSARESDPEFVEFGLSYTSGQGRSRRARLRDQFDQYGPPPAQSIHRRQSTGARPRRQTGG